MKRLAWLLVPAVAFALGAGAAKLAWYPYVPAELNAPCGKTVFEWNIMANRVDTTPIPLDANFEIVGLAVEPKAEALIVRVHLRPRNPSCLAVPPRGWMAFLAGPLATSRGLVRKRFQVEPTRDRFFLLLYIQDRLVAAERHGQPMVALPLTATPAEQLAALATIMSHAPSP